MVSTSEIKTELRQRIKDLVDSLPTENNKAALKKLHLPLVIRKTNQVTKSRANWENILHKILANGDEINPNKIDPEIVIIPRGKQTKERDYFQVATLLWSIPVSNGFGRRIRFLVRDKNNEKLIGIVGIQDPVFNRRVRDEYIGWSVDLRCEKLVNLMSCYVLGALPPYNILLGGKLAAMLIHSKEIHQEFESRYGSAEGIISKRKKNSQFVGVTNLTAYGKSAMMERIKHPPWKFIGYTKGTNTLLFNDDIFELATSLVRIHDNNYFKSYKWGGGPSWKIRILKRAFKIAKISEDNLNLGIQRGVYFAPLAMNWREILNSRENVRANRDIKTTEEIWKSFKNKVTERSLRKTSWKEYKNEDSIKVIKSLINKN